MHHQVEKWKLAKIPGTEGLVNLVVHLLLRSDGGCQVIRCLLNIMPPSNIDIHSGVNIFTIKMEHLLIFQSMLFYNIVYELINNLSLLFFRLEMLLA